MSRGETRRKTKALRKDRSYVNGKTIGEFWVTVERQPNSKTERPYRRLVKHQKAYTLVYGKTQVDFMGKPYHVKLSRDYKMVG